MWWRHLMKYYSALSSKEILGQALWCSVVTHYLGCLNLTAERETESQLPCF